MFFLASSSHTSGGKHRLGLGLAALVSVLASACFNDPKIDPTQTYHCSKDDKSCPWGSVCGADGICCESADGKTCKVQPPSGGLDATAIDSNGNEVGYEAGGAPGLDGSSDAPPSDSGVGPETGEPAGTDASPDLPQPIEAAPADVPTDPILPPLDRGPDYPTGPDVEPDLPYSPEVGPDLPPTGCVIGGTTYTNGAANPDNTCQVCKPATSPSAWLNADEGTSCGSGQYCNSGTCKAGCFIAGTYYANGAANPTNACQTCQTTFATTAWTASANGASCGTGQVCSGGTCQSGCWIDGALVASGNTNASNVCQICRPTTSTSVWANNTDGTSCGGGKICGAGVCQAGCYVGGAVYASGGLNPANGCQSCNPSISTTAWYQVPSDCATIAAHDGFTCAMTGGVAKCWGANGLSHYEGSYSGFLGIGQSYDQIQSSPTPLTVSGVGAGLQALSTGGTADHACALVNGGVECWGRNDSGQIGDGTNTDRNAPTQVTGLASGVRGIAMGASHSCALLDGHVQCWGDNYFGEVGAGGQSTTTPVTVALNGNIQAITAGTGHSCALVNGGVWCWGNNSQGQLGNNSTTNSSVPVQVVGLGSNVQAIAAGGTHTCAIANGSLVCWGNNINGPVGDATTTDRWTPVPVQGLSSGVQAVAAGEASTCAVVNGGAWCWGWNGLGQLGDNSTADRWAPVAVQGLSSGVQAITVGSGHSCALTTTGAKCWGDNSTGELGNNSTTNSLTPVSVQGL